ncbi:MAG TPA: acetoin utilization protein AcuC [Acidiferrobacteraceae bacterium]|nr:acetoin utilization protein AcuC [Acidiferrobacteraceae bacterium]
MAVGIYFGNDLGRYGFGQNHPFGPDRIYAFWKQTVKEGLDKKVCIGAPVSAQRSQIARFHTAEYIDRVIQQSVSGEGYLDRGDTPAFRGAFEAASFVVGSDLDALDAIMSGKTPRVFVPIAGLHHARRDSAAGFCVFNDVGVLIETLRTEFGVQRVAYVDIDAHHGDGVFYAFEEDPDLIFADIHEDGHYLYPGTGFAHETGKGKATGTKLNIPMEPGSDDEAFHRVWPRLEEFVRAAKPEIILLQAGADSIKDDPITHMCFSPQAHAHTTRQLCKIADEFCDGRLLAMGGGGYNRRNLALGWNAVVRAMLG